MVLQLCVLVMGTEAAPLLVNKDMCTGPHEYWNEDTGSCTESCASGFYEIDSKVKVCSACDWAT